MNHALFISLLITAAHVSAALAASLHALGIKRDSNAALLWIFVVWSFPGAGALIYLFYGIDRVERHGLRRRTAHSAFADARKELEDESLPMAYWKAVRNAARAEPSDPWAARLNRSIDPLLPDFPLLRGNRIDVLATGDEAYPAMREAIRAAKSHIHFQTFILAPDETGQEFIEDLALRAREGVTVRLMYDVFGSTPAMFRGFLRRIRRRHPELHLIGWTQVNPLRRRFQINLRNHRKVLLVDGRTAFTGGINIQNSNRTLPGRPADRDFMFRIEGSTVQELQFGFLSDWSFMSGEPPEALLTQDAFPGADDAGENMVRVVPSGPGDGIDVLPDVIFNAVAMARRQILLFTPYFVPTPDLLRCLRSAALRGVEVKLMVPRDNNHVYAGWAARSFYETLLDAGVQVFERKPPFSHSKALMVDDAFALIGSANFDARSLRLNYESNLAVLGGPFMDALKAVMLQELAEAVPVDPQAWRTRAIWRRLTENACALLTPVL